MKQISEFIKRCETCQRNEFTIALNHPAKAIQTDKIFERLHVDYIHGLPEFSDGYNCVLLMVDALSGWPLMIPMKGKTAEDSKYGFVEWFSTYGTPTTIISDRGTEFLNEVIRKVCTSTGIEHVVTAAYNPRTNGKVERL